MMLYIMRHGLTDWNTLHKLQGKTDVPLNDEGRRMAHEAASEYRDVPLDICFCSPLQRARETAQILLEGRDVPIVYDDRLAEMGFGVYEGVANSFDNPECPINVLFYHPEAYTPVEGGESLDELFARVDSFLREAVEPELAAGRNVLILAHGAINSCIRGVVEDKPRELFWSEPIPNCKMFRLR